VHRRTNPISIPNILTVIRILMTPVFVILLLKRLFGHALLVFILAGVSDALDGLIARYFNQRTILGAYLDPIADKMLLSAAFISLGILKIIPGWLVVIVISRDILILLGIAIIAFANIPVLIHPSPMSKCTTALQLATVAVTMLALQIQGIEGLLPFFFWLTAAVTTLSGLHYIYVGMNILQSGTDTANKS
jgi:cardiolipin synthase (CMP-forming)